MRLCGSEDPQSGCTLVTVTPMFRDLFDPSRRVMAQALEVIRGLSVHKKAQEMFPTMGILPYLASILRTKVHKEVHNDAVSEDLR